METLKTQLSQLIGYTHTHQMAVEHLLKTAPPQTLETEAAKTEAAEAPETT